MDYIKLRHKSCFSSLTVYSKLVIPSQQRMASGSKNVSRRLLQKVVSDDTNLLAPISPENDFSPNVVSTPIAPVVKRSSVILAEDSFGSGGGDMEVSNVLVLDSDESILHGQGEASRAEKSSSTTSMEPCPADVIQDSFEFDDSMFEQPPRKSNEPRTHRLSVKPTSSNPDRSRSFLARRSNKQESSSDDSSFIQFPKSTRRDRPAVPNKYPSPTVPNPVAPAPAPSHAVPAPSHAVPAPNPAVPASNKPAFNQTRESLAIIDSDESEVEESDVEDVEDEVMEESRESVSVHKPSGQQRNLRRLIVHDSSTSEEEVEEENNVEGTSEDQYSNVEESDEHTSVPLTCSASRFAILLPTHPAEAEVSEDEEECPVKANVTGTPIVDLSSSDEEENKENNVPGRFAVSLAPPPKIEPRSPVTAQPTTQQLQEMRQQSAERLGTLRNMHSRIDTSKLPDGGKRIQDEIAALQLQIEECDNALHGGGDGANIDESGSEVEEVEEESPEEVFEDAAEDLDQPSTSKPVEVEPPKGKTKMLTQDDLEVLYAARPHIHRLMGGRMTDDKYHKMRGVIHEALEKLHKSLQTRPAELDELPDPEGLEIKLMPHQRRALAWLCWRERQMPAGGILADEMGLGKTLTMLTLILHQKRNGEAKERRRKSDIWLSKEVGRLTPSKATLVVCPTSLINQWEGEIKKRFAPGTLTCYKFHGANRERSSHRLARYDVVLTTYGVVQSELGGDGKIVDSEAEGTDDDAQDRIHRQSILGQVAWQRIILDEAHNIKNRSSRTSKACCRLRAGARWSVTGTPLHNKLEEFYSQLKFLRCTPFDEFRVFKEQILPATKSERADRRLKVIVQALLLRRLKKDKDPQTEKDLVNIPDKTIKTIELAMSKTEQAAYDKMFAASQVYVKEYIKSQETKDNEMAAKWCGNYVQTDQTARNPFIINTKENAKSQDTGLKPKGTDVLVMLLRLRQACCHFGLMKEAIDISALQEVDGAATDGDKLADRLNDMSLVDEAVQDLGEVAAEREEAIKRLFKRRVPSTKVQAVLDCIQTILAEPRHESGYASKCVVVGQWVTFLDILGAHLQQMQIPYMSITGQVDAAERNKIVERFNEKGGRRVLFISITAGGVGLNLIGGNHLLLVDIHWNPSLEDQACDRIHRMGQKREIFVHKFVTKNTIEQRVIDIQNAKKQLATNLLSGAGAKNGNKLSLQDLKTLFDLNDPPKQRLNSRNKI